jgi:hypothetical protein
LELTALARPDLDEGEGDALTAGGRDAALLDLREALFGPTLAAVLPCPGCGVTLELTPDVADLRTTGAATSGAEQTLVQGDCEIRCRQPTMLDLAEIAYEPDADVALERLLERCVLEASVSGRPLAPDELPEAALAALDEALAAADPQADLELGVECPSCGERSSTRFDIGSFLWAELEHFAMRTLREIHVLAAAYGWSESQILELGARRRLYLELLEG